MNSLVISFEQGDMHFVEKHGIVKAKEIVENYYKNHKTPFINDTYQLAARLSMPRNWLFEITKKPQTHYKTIILHKKGGGIRCINSPDSKLKSAQWRILYQILNNIEVSKFATAYVRGKRLEDNALPHINHKYLLKMDITDFFGSITYKMVLAGAFNSQNYPTQIGKMLSEICCLNDVLPQGAPSSPMLSNIVMKCFDDIVGTWCEERNISYTRYCDDLTFSANIPLYNVYLKVTEMLEARGFKVNNRKTKFITAASRQIVTGLTVNEKVSIPSDYKSKLRQEVYYALKFGIADSISKGRKTEFLKRGAPDIHSYYNHLCGKIYYVLQIEPQNKWFLDAKEKLCAQYQKELVTKYSFCNYVI